MDIDMHTNEIIAVIVRHESARRPAYSARVLVPGRPVIATGLFPSRESASASVWRHWHEARIVDADTFAAARRRSVKGPAE